VMTVPVSLSDIEARFTELGTGDPRFEPWRAAVEEHQRTHCGVYARFPTYRYLPIQAFKMASVTTFPPEEAEAVFVSSGTGNMTRSRHHVRRLSVYRQSVLAGYDRMVRFRVEPAGERPVILGHLPAYAEESSLVAMLRILVAERGAPGSGFFLDDHSVLEQARTRGRPVLLFGAAFGLLDLIERGSHLLPMGSSVVETGGMKTHRRAIEREDLHARLAAGFGVKSDRVVSEYGMAELLSQCWSDADGWFHAPPWMRFEIINPEDGLTPLPDGTPGALALFDMANIHTVSHILTQDRAVAAGHRFRVLGRLDAAELRGCNFLLESADLSS
jgi:hypothetical protein